VLPIISEAVEMLQPLADEKELQLEVELPRGGAFGIVCDRGRLLQVLANIVGNAIKFTPAGGSIVVRVEPGITQAIFTVTDTGPGIAAQDLPHLFDRFWQAASNTQLGTGLGLAIARAIVEGQGGHIAVESRVGAGTKFTFTLPMEGKILAAP
jgi:signal transduction histidine kinase